MKKVIYEDCMNETNGLPTLESNSFDMCLTDHPWGIEIQDRLQTERIHFLSGRKLGSKERYNYYDDGFDPEFTISWFEEVCRVCKLVCIYTAWKILPFWFNETSPRGLVIVTYPNSTSRSSVSYFNNFDPMLVYGKFEKPMKRLRSNVISFVKKWGFLNNDNFIHPTPKDRGMWTQILEEIQPRSVLDPFLGSGTTAESCEYLGIQDWLGYEIDKQYKKDIDFRLENVKPKQIIKAKRLLDI